MHRGSPQNSNSLIFLFFAVTCWSINTKKYLHVFFKRCLIFTNNIKLIIAFTGSKKRQHLKKYIKKPFPDIFFCTTYVTFPFMLRLDYPIILIYFSIRTHKGYRGKTFNKSCDLSISVRLCKSKRNAPGGMLGMTGNLRFDSLSQSSNLVSLVTSCDNTRRGEAVGCKLIIKK